MNINAAPYDEDKTQHILTLYAEVDGGWEFFQEINSIQTKLLKAEIDSKYFESSKDLLKKVFGKQLICKNYHVRCWVWTFESEGIILYALASIEGISWETPSRNLKVIEVYKAVINKMITYLEGLK